MFLSTAISRRIYNGIWYFNYNTNANPNPVEQICLGNNPVSSDVAELLLVLVLLLVRAMDGR